MMVLVRTRSVCGLAAVANLLLFLAGLPVLALPPASGKALDSPACVKAAEATNERNTDEVLGVGRKGEFCAYPLRMMALHRVVNDHLGGPPIVVAYDPDSAAGAVYDPIVNGAPLTFDAAAARGGVPMLRDRETGSAWSLLTGESLDGRLKGRRLEKIASLILTWRSWNRLHKDSWSLKEDTALASDYGARSAAESPAPAVAELPKPADTRLRPDTMVLGVVVDGRALAYPLADLLTGAGVQTVSLRGRRIAILSDPAAHTAAAFELQPVEGSPKPILTARDADGERVFTVAPAGRYAFWSVDGATLERPDSGKSAGARLMPLECGRCRWYAWSAVFPKTELRRPIAKRHAGPADTAPAIRGALLLPSGFDGARAARLRSDGYNTVAFSLGSGGAAAAIKAARGAGLRVYGWIQVARDETAANAHPEWMHTPQHSEWLGVTDHTTDPAVDSGRVSGSASGISAPRSGRPRGRAVPAVARLASGTHVSQRAPCSAVHGAAAGDRYVVFPWVSVNNRAVFAYERQRIRSLVSGLPKIDGLFLCDIQGAPMGCGCGNPLCRSWDNSPGAKIAAAPYEHPSVYFSEVFVRTVREDLPGLDVLPVLCEECENGVQVGPAFSPDLDGACHHIPCSHPCSLDYYPGLLRSLQGARPIGLLSFYRMFKKNRPEYGPEAAWGAEVVRRVHRVVPGQPVIAVVQGWSGSPAQRSLQIQRALEGGASGYIVALTYVRESWEARKAVE